jgi:hypothetical protein
MNSLPSKALVLLTLLSAMLTPGMAQGHLMPAQHGTLNIRDDGVFMVLSLPMSAFENIDADGDGMISMIEFNIHRGAMLAAIKRSIAVLDNRGEGRLTGAILSPVRGHDVDEATVTHLVIMGRFHLDDYAAPMTVRIDLYGTGTDEQSLDIRASRELDGQSLEFELTPSRMEQIIF